MINETENSDIADFVFERTLSAFARKKVKILPGQQCKVLYELILFIIETENTK